MNIIKEKNKIFFNLENKSFANISIDNYNINLELLKTLPEHRNKKLASRLMEFILSHLRNEKRYNFIYLNPLPLCTNGLKIDQLIEFYSKFGFSRSCKADISSPYLMERII